MFKRIPLDFKARETSSPSVRTLKPGIPSRIPSALASWRPRSRNLIAAAVAAVFLAAAMQLGSKPTAAKHSAAAQPSAAAPLQADTLSVTSQELTDTPAETLGKVVLEIQSGDTLDRLFRHHDLSISDLHKIMQLPAARQHLRVLRPGNIIEITHQDGEVLGLTREVDLYTALEVDREDGDFVASTVRLPVESRLVEATGRISRSLYEAGAEAQLSDRLIMNLTDIFRWDIDFVRDIGMGDEFTLVYEELWRDGGRLGQGNILAAEFVNRGSNYTAVRFEESEGNAAYYSKDGRPMQKAFLRVPVAFTRISSEFNPRRRHPILNTIRAHKGVDYAAPTGTPVKAAGEGKITFRGWKSGYGNTVIVQHGGKVTTLYGHLSRFATDARYGSRVRQGEVIGFVGATGLATAPHLHYEYRRNGVHLNPRTVDLPDAEPLTGAQLAAFQTAARPLLERLEVRRTVLAANQTEG